jgi:type IV pilus assembly protein PilC
MKKFKYTARDEKGKYFIGVLQAEAQEDVVAWMSGKSFKPVLIQPVRKENKESIFSHGRRVKSEDLASLCWQLNTMIEGGVPITDAMDTITEDIPNLRLRKALKDVSGNMQSGEAFSSGIKKFPGIFNTLFCSMVEAGESSGTLTVVLQRLADYFDRRDALTRKVKQAMAYPIFVVGFVIVLLGVMMTFIIPRFLGIFSQMKGELPAFTRGFIAVYNCIMHNFPYIAGIGTALVLSIVAYCKTEKGHIRYSKFVLKLPLIGSIIKQAFIVTFCKTCATLLGAGVSVLDAIPIMSDMTKNDVIRVALLATKTGIEQGGNISSSMAKTGLYPSVMVKMVQVGEESGSLPAVLDRTSLYYEKRVDNAIATMVTLLEPTLIISVGAIILVVLLALYLPIFYISNIKA